MSPRAPSRSSCWRWSFSARSSTPGRSSASSSPSPGCWWSWVRTPSPASNSTAVLLGDILVFASIVMWGCFTVFGKKLTDQLGALTVTATVTLIGATWMAPVGWFEMRHTGFSLAGITPTAWTAVIFLGAACNFLAVLLYFTALQAHRITEGRGLSLRHPAHDRRRRRAGPRRTDHSRTGGGNRPRHRGSRADGTGLNPRPGPCPGQRQESGTASGFSNEGRVRIRIRGRENQPAPVHHHRRRDAGATSIAAPLVAPTGLLSRLQEAAGVLRGAGAVRTGAASYPPAFIFEIKACRRSRLACGHCSLVL